MLLSCIPAFIVFGYINWLFIPFLSVYILITIFLIYELLYSKTLRDLNETDKFSVQVCKYKATWQGLKGFTALLQLLEVFS